MNDKTPQSRLAREREITVRGLADQSATRVSKVFASLPNEREKITAESVFGSSLSSKKTVNVHVLRKRVFAPKPGQDLK